MKLVRIRTHFLINWKELTQDQGISPILEGYQITLLRDPVQRKLPHSAKTNAEQMNLVNKGIRSILKKEATQNVFHSPRGLMSNVFLVEKADGVIGR